jgi:membrane-bound metal-dependent hydrolase YbcI (DUF457 family)
MRFISHLLVGIIILVIFYFLVHPEISILIPSAIALLSGSVLPDIDHPFSKVRQAFRLLAFLILLVLSSVFFSITPVQQIFQDQCITYGCEEYTLLVQLIVAAIVSFILVMVIDFFIPFHRGPLHGVAAAVGYAFLCGILAMNYSSSYFIIAAAGLIGYLAHIIPDVLFKE